MRDGDICLDKGKDWISRAIEDFEHSGYSHATVYIDGQLMEAYGFKLTGYTSIDKYKGELDIFTCDILTDENRKNIKQFLDKQIGTHYDYLLLFVEAIRYLLHITLYYKEPFHSHICSTLAADAYKSVGVDICPGIKYPSPGDIANSKLLRKIGSI